LRRRRRRSCGRKPPSEFGQRSPTCPRSDHRMRVEGCLGGSFETGAASLSRGATRPVPRVLPRLRREHLVIRRSAPLGAESEHHAGDRFRLRDGAPAGERNGATIGWSDRAASPLGPDRVARLEIGGGRTQPAQTVASPTHLNTHPPAAATPKLLAGVERGEGLRVARALGDRKRLSGSCTLQTADGGPKRRPRRRDRCRRR
jgi:hypothetical protein